MTERTSIIVLLVVQRAFEEAEAEAKAARVPLLAAFNDALEAHAAHIGCPHVIVGEGYGATVMSAPGCTGVRDGAIRGDFANWQCAGIEIP